MTTFISKDTISRLLKDVKQIMKNPLTENGIYYIHDDIDMLKGYALIIGPSDTPYFGGNYFFELDYPIDYPHSPPKVKYCTNGNNIRFNPNLYKCGKVCVSLLNTWRGDQWTSCQSISTVLLTLCTLLCTNPLLNEPGIIKNNPEVDVYTEIIQFSNIDIAICDIINRKKCVHMQFFDHFYPFVKENFTNNYDKIIEFVENKINENKESKESKESKEYKESKESKILKTNMYCMTVEINYVNLLNKLKDCKIQNK
jgi:ubiquitin-conjugating enzyme E2 Z